MTPLYTISALTENSSGVLHRITAIFTRRKVNIESLCVSETETKGISRFTISVRCEEELARKMVAQICRVIEVISADFSSDQMLLSKEIALFRVRAETVEIRADIEERAKRYGAAIALAAPNFVIVEKTGSESEIDSLLLLLEPLGILEFIRSGRISLRRS